MSIVVQQLPEKLAADMLARPEFVGMCVSSWRYGAYATGDTIVHAFNALHGMPDGAERAYLGWEIIGSVVELTEMAATAWLNRRAPSEFAVHQASNAQIEALWTDIRSNGAGVSEIRAFLHLNGPGGFSMQARRTVRVYERILDRVNLALRDIATFWTEQAANARWFRHYPATLTPEEAGVIDSGNAEQRREIMAQMAAVTDALEFATHMQDARSFGHTVLRKQDVAAAVQVGDLAIQLIMNWLANSGLDPSQPRNRSHIFPIFTRHLSANERAILTADGTYALD